MINPFCYIGCHNWEYRKEKHKVENHPDGRDSIRVVVRECKWCRHREHHTLPRPNRKFERWENWDKVSKDDILDYKKLYEYEIQNQKVS